MNNSINTDAFLIERCKKLIETKINLGESRYWKQRDFEYLSELIFDASNILLSVSTLKRLWKQEKESLPHSSTLNALAVFTGYKDWNDFKKNFSDINKTDSSGEGGIKTTPAAVFLKMINRLFVGGKAQPAVSIIILLLISSYVIIKSSTGNSPNKDKVDYSNIKFSYKKVVSNGLPNTVIFNYDISDVNRDSAIIQQSWDTRRRAKVSKYDRHFTSIYYFPGYHNAKLVIDNKIIRSHNIHITTDGWLALARYSWNDLIPVYIYKGNIIDKGCMYVPPQILKENKVDISQGSYWVSFYNVRDFGSIDSDNFILETQVKNSLDEGGLIGQFAAIIIMCERSRMMIPLTIPGCVSEIRLKFNEKNIHGRNNDLSVFGCDLTNWNNIRCEVIDKQVNIFLNGEYIYELSYERSSGKIIGLHYMFHGCGAVNFIRLYDTDEKLLYEDNFDTL